jgi:hypothetical protein
MIIMASHGGSKTWWRRVGVELKSESVSLVFQRRCKPHLLSIGIDRNQLRVFMFSSRISIEKIVSNLNKSKMATSIADKGLHTYTINVGRSARMPKSQGSTHGFLIVSNSANVARSRNGVAEQLSSVLESADVCSNYQQQIRSGNTIFRFGHKTF